MMDGCVGLPARGAGRGRLRPGRDPGLLGQVRLGATTARSATAADSTPAFGDRARLPDGSGQRARGDARGRARRRGGRRHRHGQAGARLPRRDRARCAASSTCPIAAYNVSRRVRDAEGRGRAAAGSTTTASMLETLTSIRRAGADIILTYHAKEAARLLTKR